MSKIVSKIRKIKNIFLNVDTQTPFDKLRQHEYILVSFPKSGRTWISLILKELGIDIPVTHDGTGHVRKIHFNRLIKDKTAYGGNKVILLLREPKDTVVSGYFHSTRRKQVFNGSIDKFIRSPKHGVEKIVRFNTNWLKNKDIPKDFHLIIYENMQKDIYFEIKKLLKFLNIEDISDKKIKDVIAFTSFDNMQKLEKEGYFKDTFGEGLTPKNINDIESYKTRKGKVGGYVDYLTLEQIEYCNTIIKKYNYNFETFLR